MNRIGRRFSSRNNSNETPESREYYLDYFIDSPRIKHINSRTVHVEGWLIPFSLEEKIQISVKLKNSTMLLSLDKARPDVAQHFTQHKMEDIVNCGFSDDIECEDGEITIDLIVNGVAVRELHRMDLIYSPEDLVDMVKNPNLSDYMAEHEILIANKKKYYYEENHDKAYEPHEDDPKLIAFYLPQYHPFPENDKAWGKGFTEWTNVAIGKPRFVGHQQPVLPSALGFYDLRVDQTIKDQIDLAKQHGVYGFCFYYYWFSGKKIMDTPLNSFLGHKEWDFNFTICWANENWTKRWDGRDQDVIIGQKYKKDDPLKFIEDVAPILNDKRYIHKDGRPVLVVYRASELKQPMEYVRVWRRYFKEKYNKELYLVSSMGFEIGNPKDYGFDTGIDFAPQTTLFKEDSFPNNTFPYVKDGIKLIDQKFNGSIVSYRDIALNSKINNYFDFPVIKSIPPSWDNDARKKGAGFIMHASNPDLYGAWLDSVLNQDFDTLKHDKSFIFINAWNEWAEGAVLEPSMHLGYANLNRTTEVIAKYSKNPNNLTNFPMYGYKKLTKQNNIACYVHIGDSLTASEISKIVQCATSVNYDIYITAISKYEEVLNNLMNESKDIFGRIVPNRGGGTLPFIHMMRKCKLEDYRTIIKIDASKGWSKTHLEKLISLDNTKNWILTLTDQEGVESQVCIENVTEFSIDRLSSSVIINMPAALEGVKWLDVEDFPAAT